MSEFINYKVKLSLKDGTTCSGIIANVSNSLISLVNVTQSVNPSQTIPTVDIPSINIVDLKVTQLPAEILKNSKGKNSKNSGNNVKASTPTPQPSLLDDAIVFSSAPSKIPKPTDKKSSDIQKGASIDRSGTPSRRATELPWEGDNAQDIKPLPEFDFAANLAMFDKKSIFDDFRKKDTVNPNERLVGHNKVESVKNQKSFKQKYENHEMVLDSNKLDNWENIGRTNSNKTPDLTRITSNANRDTTISRITFVNSNSLNEVPLATPVQLLEIERLSSESYEITPNIMAEVSASNLSQLIANDILGGTTRLSNKKNHNLPPLVLLLVGTGRCGSRAFATGRHLSNHGIRVLAFVLHNDYSDKEFTKQWKLFESTDGKVIKSSVEVLLDVIDNQLDTPVELILDALQGYDEHIEDIFYEEEAQKGLKDLISWCNLPSQEKKIMSLDVPSGIDGGSGTIQDPELRLKSKWCISMGLPITGLAHAYKNGHLEEGEISHYLIDVGIPNKVYSSKGNLRKFDKFWHCAESTIKLHISNE